MISIEFIQALLSIGLSLEDIAKRIDLDIEYVKLNEPQAHM